MTLSSTAVTGGTSVTGTVRLNAPAPAGGAVVTISSDNSAASVPATIIIAEGSNSATFSITTDPVATAMNAMIMASYGFDGQGIGLGINPATLSSMTLDPTSVTGGQTSTGTVTLSGPAPSKGVEVDLSSNSADATLPAKVTIPAGQNSATFSISTRKVASKANVQIKATLGKASMTADLSIAK